MIRRPLGMHYDFQGTVQTYARETDEEPLIMGEVLEPRQGRLHPLAISRSPQLVRLRKANAPDKCAEVGD